jgi:putative endonuclease
MVDPVSHLRRWWRRLACLVCRRFTRYPDNLAWTIGARGEDIAVKFLKKKNMRPLVRNWRDGRYELDGVFLDGSTLVFVEVRTRSHAALQSGYNSICSRKKRALRTAATRYLRSLTQRPPSFRFDVVEIEWFSPKNYVCRHFENVRWE